MNKEDDSENDVMRFIRFALDIRVFIMKNND